MSIDTPGRRPLRDERHYRRGLYLLPTLFTVGNMFCGYACVIFAMRGELSTAAPFIGVAAVLDMLDGRIARMTKTSSAFGLELDSLADVISFGVAPAMLAFAWGLSELGRFWWAAGFVYVTAAAMRLARFNLHTTAQTDKRYFVGMPSPAAAGLIAASVFAWPDPLSGVARAVAAVTIVLVPAALMVSTMRFRSFKTINFGWTQSYIQIVIVAVAIAAIATAPRLALVLLAYGYLLSAFIEEGLTRYRLRRSGPPAPESP
jgi:CDP-diacylglycerol--serine O-phosphatidyltransferase